MKTLQTYSLETDIFEGTILDNETMIKVTRRPLLDLARHNYLLKTEKRLLMKAIEEWPSYLFQKTTSGGRITNKLLEDSTYVYS